MCGGKSKAPGRRSASSLSEQGGLPPAVLAHVEHQKNGRVEGAQDRADEEDGQTRGSESKRGLHKEAQ